MWCDIEAAADREFEFYHTQEHFAERVGIPGFLRGSRWKAVDGSSTYFVMYELAEYDVFTGDAYLERLNNPTTWSVKMMPKIGNMVRSPCDVTASCGAGFGTSLITCRFAPEPGREKALRAWLRDRVLPGIAALPGMNAAHLLENRVPEGIEPTWEERTRGGDAMADWALLVNGYSAQAVRAVLAGPLGEDVMAAQGARPGRVVGEYALRLTMQETEVA